MCIRDRYVFARRGPEAACIRTRPGSRPPRLAWLRWLTGVVNGRSSWWRWKPPACTGSRSTTPWRTASGCGCATHTTSRMCRGVRPTCPMLTGWLTWPHHPVCGHGSQPVSIRHVGLTPRHILDVVCVAQPHPEAVLQGVVDRLPVHAGGFHRHQLDRPFTTPVSHLNQASRGGLEPGLVLMPAASGPRRANTYCHLVAVDIAPGDPLVDLFHGLLLRLRAPCARAAGEDLRNQPNLG